MPDKEPTAKIWHIFGLERSPGPLPRCLSRKPAAPPRDERVAKLSSPPGLEPGPGLYPVSPDPCHLQALPGGGYLPGERQGHRGVSGGGRGDHRAAAAGVPGPEPAGLRPGRADGRQGAAAPPEGHGLHAPPFPGKSPDSLGRRMARAGRQDQAGVPYKALLEHKPEFDRLLGVSIPNSTFHLLAKLEFSPYLEAMISQVLVQFFNQGVISSRTVLQPDPQGDPGAAPAFPEGDAGAGRPSPLSNWTRGGNRRRAIAGKWRRSSRRRNAGWCAT